MAANVVLALAFAGSAALVAVLAVPSIGGQVPRNRLYGVRFKKAFESDEHWYAINRFGGWQLLGYALCLGVLAALLAVLPGAKLQPGTWYFWPVLLAPAWLILPWTWRIARFCRRL